MRAKPSLPSVARSRRFQQALGKRLKVLDRELPAALRHDAEALHRSRVASRRLREVLPVIEGQPGDGAFSAKKSRGRVRRLTRALGGVRELDVALALLDELSLRDDGLAGATAAVRLVILQDRAVRYADMLRRLEDIRPGRLTRELASLASEPGGAPSTREQRRRLRDRLLRRARRLDQAMENAGSLYAFDRLHEVRIAAKKLRYVLELVQELAAVGTTRLVARLKEAQDRLGRLHDLEILAGYVRRTRAAASDGTIEGADRLVDVIDRETRELHAEYLRGAAALRALVAGCRDVGARLRGK